MKKLLVLMLVLGFASMAQGAIYFQVEADESTYTDGWEDVNDNQKLDASDYIYIKIVLQGATTMAYDLDLHISGPGTLSEHSGGPSSNYQTNMASMGFTYSGIDENGNIDQMMDAVMMGSFVVGDLVWGLRVHCEGEGRVDLDLTLGGLTKVTPTGGSEITITEDNLGGMSFDQVPEPMTLGLLALGSLALLRRRRT